MSSFEGKPAFEFSLIDQHGTTHELQGYRGKYVLLYFYPKDNTPGCTKEACGFRDAMNDFVGSDVQVLGVSADSVEQHKKFAEQYHLNFPLLVDEDGKLAKQYGVLAEKSMFGKTFMGLKRESFLIDPNGIVVKHYRKVKPEKHPEEVLTDVRALKQRS